LITGNRHIFVEAFGIHVGMRTIVNLFQALTSCRDLLRDPCS
jgi:hypothetical protein